MRCKEARLKVQACVTFLQLFKKAREAAIEKAKAAKAKEKAKKEQKKLEVKNRWEKASALQNVVNKCTYINVTMKLNC